MTEPIGGSDEVFHPAGDDPDWNESAWFGFSIPERDMNGFVYFFHDVRTGVSGGGPALWDPSGEETYDCLCTGVRILLDAEDDRGRSLHARGDVRTALRWLGWPGRLTFWTLTDWHWDGLQGWGEDQEFFAREQVRALIK